MSKFAPVVPLQAASVLKREGLLGDYHLLLAHDVLAHPAEYRAMYEPDMLIILDNSVVELGQALSVKDMMEAAKIITPDFLVAPDVMGNGKETARVAQEFVMEWHALKWEVEERPRPQIMGVIQGPTYTASLECKNVLLARCMVNALSVPRVLVQSLGSRSPVLDNLAATYSGPVHLLGFSDNLLDDLACARRGNVMGIDSAVPIRAAVDGAGMVIDTEVNYGPRGDFWNVPVQVIEEVLSEGCLRDNINDIRRWIEL